MKQKIKKILASLNVVGVSYKDLAEKQGNKTRQSISRSIIEGRYWQILNAAKEVIKDRKEELNILNKEIILLEKEVQEN